MAEIVKLVPRTADADETGNGTGDVAVWLRKLADRIDAGEFGAVSAGVVVLREDIKDQFCLRTRRCNMNYIEQAGMLQMMHHDMLHA